MREEKGRCWGVGVRKYGVRGGGGFWDWLGWLGWPAIVLWGLGIRELRDAFWVFGTGWAGWAGRLGWLATWRSVGGGFGAGWAIWSCVCARWTDKSRYPLGRCLRQAFLDTSSSSSCPLNPFPSLLPEPFRDSSIIRTNPTSPPRQT